MMDKIGYNGPILTRCTVNDRRGEPAVFRLDVQSKRRPTKNGWKRYMELVELSEHMKKQVKQYSGGMKRRLSLPSR